jgi:enoyl-CoA hydratase/carnithine racemase
MTTTAENAPRPPDGDWLGTPFLRFDREGPFGVCTLDRPEARNAMTAAMYFGIRYAVRHVDADPHLAGLLITGTGDVFAPGGDMVGGGADNWLTYGSALGMDVTPFETLRQSSKPVVSAVNGLCQGGGLQIAMCSDMAVVRPGTGAWWRGSSRTTTCSARHARCWPSVVARRRRPGP